MIVEAAATDTGMRRSNNQDSHSIVRATNPDAWKARGHIYMVADGMGAHAAGELASKLACDNIPHNYAKIKNVGHPEAITKAYREVASIIFQKANANRDFQGMGTTCSTLILLPEGALIAHVGDSRVYRIRAGRIDQLSFDHSLVWELVRRNHLSPDQAQKAVPRNVITRSLGPDPNIEVDIEGPHPTEPGDVYLLCSDGLSGPVTDPELGVFAENFHPKDAGRYLVALANLRGGQDNITVVMARIGPWIEPDTAPDVPKMPESSAESNGKAKGGLLKGLSSLFGGKKPVPVPVEEHLYRSAECPISPELLSTLEALVAKAEANAREQNWPIDWTVLESYRASASQNIAASKSRSALRDLGEAIVILGTGGRLHKKSGGAAHVR